MTESEQKEMRQRYYIKRLKTVRNKYNLPRLSNVQRVRLVDLLMRIEGDPVNEVDLRVMHRLATRIKHWG